MGGFTERQKNELKTIFKDMSKELIRDIVNNTVFVDAIAKQVADTLTQKLEDLNLTIQTIQENLSDIKLENEVLKGKVDELEQMSKLDQLRFYGLQENSNENLKISIENIIKSKLEVNNFEIMECYRVGKSIKGKPRVAIVKFGNEVQRNEVFLNKKKIKNS